MNMMMNDNMTLIMNNYMSLLMNNPMLQHESTSDIYQTTNGHSAEHVNGAMANKPNQNLITYELERVNVNASFGFDLKGDRPAMISAVHPGSSAELAGLREGDLVISINNRKVIDLDHQQVLRLVDQSKHKVILQVTKMNTTSDYTFQRPKPNKSVPIPQQISRAPQMPMVQMNQTRYQQLLNIIDEMGREIRTCYLGNKNSVERLKRGIASARILVKDCQLECERNSKI